MNLSDTRDKRIACGGNPISRSIGFTINPPPTPKMPLKTPVKNAAAGKTNLGKASILASATVPYVIDQAIINPCPNP